MGKTTYECQVHEVAEEHKTTGLQITTARLRQEKAAASMTGIDLPAHLVNENDNGNIVLFLGAGASMECVDEHGKRPSTLPKSRKFFRNGFWEVISQTTI